MPLAIQFDNAVHSLFQGATRRRTLNSLVKIGDDARDRKEWPRAVKAYAAAISSGLAGDGLKVQLGHALKETCDFDGAERMYRQFLRDHPDDPDIHLQLGHLFNKKGELADALAFYEQALKLAPADAEILFHASSARRNAGRSETVRKRDTAMALVADRKWEEARRMLRSLVAVDGEKDLIGILANVTKETGRLDEAAALYGGYLQYAVMGEKSELVADCYRQLGHLHKIKGDYSVALDHFLSARKIERAGGADEQEETGIEREILSCLREIYPCFLFS